MANFQPVSCSTAFRLACRILPFVSVFREGTQTLTSLSHWCHKCQSLVIIKSSEYFLLCTKRRTYLSNCKCMFSIFRMETTACLLNWFGKEKTVRRKTEQLICGLFSFILCFQIEAFDLFVSEDTHPARLEIHKL